MSGQFTRDAPRSTRARRIHATSGQPTATADMCTDRSTCSRHCGTNCATSELTGHTADRPSNGPTQFCSDRSADDSSDDFASCGNMEPEQPRLSVGLHGNDVPALALYGADGKERILATVPSGEDPLLTIFDDDREVRWRAAPE